jgi:hypothetical protein
VIDLNTNMNTFVRLLCGAVLGLGLAHTTSFAQTDGGAKLETTILDYNGSGANHYTVVWVTTSSGTFIKSLRKQGPSSFTSSQWANHCGVWNTARAGSTALDGYSSATATTYAGTNSPIIWTWNCRDANNNLVADGDYRFWVQYAEDNGQGPATTSGLLWTKDASGATNTYPNQGANFSNMKVTWTPSVSSVAPTITSAPPTGAGTVGVPYNFTCTATGTAPITFSASGLPTGLTISTSGVISGTPTAAGTFSGTVTAGNGTLPNATQGFSIVISVVPTKFNSVRMEGTKLVMGGTGPANGTYAVMTATNANAPAAQWIPIVTNPIGASGSFSYTNALNVSVPRTYYRLRVP